jgi:cystathionine beta-lyase/cystathionine gamma-synthase
VAFASGQAASMALMLALTPGRERIVLPDDGYYGGRVLADRLRPHSTRPVPVDLRDLAAVERELMAAPSLLGFGPLLSFEVTPDSADAVDKVVAASRLILPATSFGGVESTWERRARWPAETAPAGLIRMSVGVEPAADLITDIDHALEVL